MSTSSTVDMKSKIVVGAGDMLDLVYHTWLELDATQPIHRLEIPQDEAFAFDFRLLEAIDPSATALFVAFDERFGNFKRLELMQGAMARGFRLETIVSHHAVVATDVRLGPNVFVGPRAVLGAKAVVDFNAVVNAGAIVGLGARVKASCWIGSGVLVGNHAEIGAHSSVRPGVVIGEKVRVGRYCDIGVPGLYRTDVKAKTVFDLRYDEPLLVHGE